MKKFVIFAIVVLMYVVCSCTMVRSYTTHAYSVEGRDTTSTITTTTAEKYDWTNKR